MFTLAASATVVAGRISSSASPSSSTSSSSSPGLLRQSSKNNFFVSFQPSQEKQLKKRGEGIVIRATENDEDEYMFKPTANAGGKGGVLDRNNPLLEEKFAIIGDGEYEYVFVL